MGFTGGVGVTTDERNELIMGMRDCAALLPGTVPFGLALGTVAAQSGLPALVSHSSSYVIFAGSAQLITLSMMNLESLAPPMLILITALVLNLRHVLYSASLAPHLKHLGWRWKVLLSYLTTDETYAVSIQRLQAGNTPRIAHWHFLGANLLLWASWQTSTLLGLFISGAIPASWGLGFAVPATFIAIVFPALKDKPMMAAALVGGVIAVLCAGLPFKSGILVAAAAGIAAGMLTKHLVTNTTA